MRAVVLSADGEVVCGNCSVADSAAARMRGLLGRTTLERGDGLLLRPAGSIHTAFMRFPIDVVFLDREMNVVRVVPGVRPWRAAIAHGGKAVLELPAGECERRGIVPGVRLSATEHEARRERSGMPRAVPAGVGAALAVAAVLRFGFGGYGFVAALFAAVLGVLAVIDLERRLIPNRIVLPAAAAVLVAQCALYPQHAAEWVLGALGGAGVLLLLALIRPGGLGMGDVKLGLLMGAGLGLNVVPALVVGSLAAWPGALYMLVRHGRAGLKRTIPFGPALALGALIVLFVSEAPS